MQRDPVSQMLDPLKPLRRGSANDAVDVIALIEQQLSDVGPVLARDPS
jgi:hypothetical protein